MHAEETIVANVTLSTSQPTTLTFHQLDGWVIWQFPRKKNAGLSGAVRPSIAKHGWYPAVIYPREKQVQVHAHLDTLYASPEEASDSLS
ncbi:MAG: hypothetical protein IPM39_07830 [Chloroflexi bacterium]|nr:hypothetical protein [Chloroflexota bacterium]